MLFSQYCQPRRLQTQCQVMFPTQENMILASRRTVAPTSVVRKIYCEEVTLGESSPENAQLNWTIFFHFLGILSLFQFFTVHCNHVFPLKNTCDILYSTPRLIRSYCITVY